LYEIDTPGKFVDCTIVMFSGFVGKAADTASAKVLKAAKYCDKNMLERSQKVVRAGRQAVLIRVWLEPDVETGGQIAPSNAVLKPVCLQIMPSVLERGSAARRALR
jgi:hypothetical protein